MRNPKCSWRYGRHAFNGVVRQAYLRYGEPDSNVRSRRRWRKTKSIHLKVDRTGGVGTLEGDDSTVQQRQHFGWSVAGSCAEEGGGSFCSYRSIAEVAGTPCRTAVPAVASISAATKQRDATPGVTTNRNRTRCGDANPNATVGKISTRGTGTDAVAADEPDADATTPFTWHIGGVEHSPAIGSG